MPMCCSTCWNFGGSLRAMWPSWPPSVPLPMIHPARGDCEKADADVSPDEMLKLDFEFYVELTRTARNRVFQLLINTIRMAVSAHAAFLRRFCRPPPFSASAIRMSSPD